MFICHIRIIVNNAPLTKNLGGQGSDVILSKKIPKRLREKARQLFEAIRDQFPECENAWDIISFALHDKSSVIYKERIPVDVRAKIIVRNHVRHVKTPYELYLGDGVERDKAREAIRAVQEEKMLELRGLLPRKCSTKEMLERKFNG